MATRSNIGARQEDGTIRVIYCHWDGYPEGVGATLAEHYTESAKIDALLNLGDLSTLGDTVEECELIRQGEPWRTFQTLQEWQEWSNNSDVEFLYFFDEDSFNGEKGWNFFSLRQRWHALPIKVTT